MLVSISHVHRRSLASCDVHEDLNQTATHASRVYTEQETHRAAPLHRVFVYLNTRPPPCYAHGVGFLSKFIVVVHIGIDRHCKKTSSPHMGTFFEKFPRTHTYTPRFLDFLSFTNATR
jgi:hypothetical protein